jgi:glycine/D-amino acid oxidase-like deaminating enzyme
MARAPSFWLEQLGPREHRPQLHGPQTADVCIIGAGFTGLWTAYELLRADTSLRVVVLEAEYAGFGASGRNGGWVFGKLAGTPEAWRRRGGPDAPGAMAEAIQRTVGEIGQVVELEQIDCDWFHGGSLNVARSEPQLTRLKSQLEHLHQSGETGWKLIDARELRQRIRIESGLGALFTPHCARVQPAKLAVGLIHAAERQGAVIYEGSPAVEISPHRVRTSAGVVDSRYVVVATEGYTANLPGRHRALLPLNSAMIVTEPLSGEVWAGLGWEGAETLSDASHLFVYAQRTADGRIAIGGRGVPYRFGSRTDREGPIPEQTVRELRERLAALFPELDDAPITRGWHGVLGVSRDWCPGVGFDPATGLASAGGYAGEGVAAANLAARTLRDLILGRDTELTRLPWVGTQARSWEPEPLRFLGARGVYRLYREADRVEERSGRPSYLATVANAIAGH